MHGKGTTRLLLAVLMAGLLMVSDVVHAQTGNGYDLTWWTVDGGGGASSGAGYRLAGTIGQAEPGPAPAGDGYTLVSGFWPAGAGSHEIYLPLTLRNSS
jgi:hypothetical protein